MSARASRSLSTVGALSLSPTSSFLLPLLLLLFVMIRARVIGDGVLTRKCLCLATARTASGKEEWTKKNQKKVVASVFFFWFEKRKERKKSRKKRRNQADLAVAVAAPATGAAALAFGAAAAAAATGASSEEEEAAQRAFSAGAATAGLVRQVSSTPRCSAS